MLERDGARLRFRHPLIRSAAYRAASPAERRSAHAAIARVVADEPHRPALAPRRRERRSRRGGCRGAEPAAADARRRGAPAVAAARSSAPPSSARHATGAAGRLLGAAELSVELGDPGAVAALLAKAEALEPDRHGRARARWIRETLTTDASEDAAPVRSLIAEAREARLGGDAELALRLLLAAGTRCWWALPADAPVREGGGGQRRSAPAPRTTIRACSPCSPRRPPSATRRCWSSGSSACERPAADPMDAHLLGQAAHMVGQSRLAVRPARRASRRSGARRAGSRCSPRRW